MWSLPPVKRKIVFNEAEHSYTDEVNTKYISVTTLIKRYEIPFDREYWLKEKASKLKISVEELDKEWQRINKHACDKGNKIHNHLEDNINVLYNINKSKQFSFYRGERRLDKEALDKSDLQNTYPKIYSFLVRLLNSGYTLYAEYRVYNSEIGVSGTIDVLAVKGNDFIIVDWKTNKDILCFNAGYFKKNYLGKKTDKFVHTHKYFKFPLDNVEFCKGEIYTLQLSLYAYLAELFGLNCKGLYLWHIRYGEHLYQIKYRKEEVFKMLKHYYKNK